ncbi:MAG TPA: sigma-70 family RNA polymerase sigma factor [Pirellulales bacterium]|nr:sigma-70 family RNA polymerase sigma factor [Pirellulales bacterium]
MQDFPATIGPELFAWLVDQHSARMMLYARQFCDCPEDAVQETLLALARQPRAPDRLLPWLYRTLRHAAIDASRRRARRRRREGVVAAGASPWFTPRADDRLDAETAVASLERLSAAQREIVVAHLWGGLSFAEIADLVHVSDSTVHRHYHEAIRELRSQLGESCLPIATIPKRL